MLPAQILIGALGVLSPHTMLPALQGGQHGVRR